MEENMNTEQGTQAEDMGNETEVQGTAPKAKGKEPKLFTQEEVNGFIQSRLSRMRDQASKEVKAEYDQKLADLQAREMRMMVREKLDERGMSRELADIITCTDEEDLNSKLDTLQKIYGSAAAKKEKSTGFRAIGSVPGSGENGPDPVRKAMGLDKR